MASDIVTDAQENDTVESLVLRAASSPEFCLSEQAVEWLEQLYPPVEAGEQGEV